jgi:hypothetical protein
VGELACDFVAHPCGKDLGTPKGPASETNTSSQICVRTIGRLRAMLGHLGPGWLPVPGSGMVLESWLRYIDRSYGMQSMKYQTPYLYDNIFRWSPFPYIFYVLFLQLLSRYINLIEPSFLSLILS